MFCDRLAVILALMMVIENVKCDDARCDHFSDKYFKDSSWLANTNKTIVHWMVKSKAPPACQSPSNGGLCDVTRIQTPTNSRTICTGCPGTEAVATDVKLCTDSYVSQQDGLSCKSPFGPCSGVTVYRCACSQPMTEAPPTTTPGGFWR